MKIGKNSLPKLPTNYVVAGYYGHISRKTKQSLILTSYIMLRGGRGRPENSLNPPKDIYEAYLKSTNNTYRQFNCSRTLETFI